VSSVLLQENVKEKMGRRKKEDTERLVREQELKLDAQFKLDDELTELFIRCEKITNKFLYDNSTQEEKDNFDYPVTNKNKIVNSILRNGNLLNRRTPGVRLGEDDDLIRHILIFYEPEIMKSIFCPKWKIELDNSAKYSRLDMSIKNERRPEPIKYNWGK